MTNRLNFWLLAILIFVAAPFWWYMLDARTGDAQAKNVSIEQLRALADAMPGAKPLAVRYELVATRYVARSLLAAGSGLRPTRFSVRAFALTLPAGRIITIDSGMSARTAEQFEFSRYSREAQARVDKALARADLTLFLADHPLHTSGADAGATRHRSAPADAHGVIARSATGSDGAPYAVAPGIVAIPLPDLPNNDTMFFVRLASGHEYLFTGAVAPTHQNWEDMRPPARIMTSYIRPMPRAEIVSWLMTIKALKAASPQMTVIEAFDQRPVGDALRGFSASHVSGEGSGSGQASGKARSDTVRGASKKKV